MAEGRLDRPWGAKDSSKPALVLPARRRTASCHSWVSGERVELNYSKLRELCLRHKLEPRTPDGDGDRSFHDKFMAEYRSMFRCAPRRRASSSRVQRHSCSTTASSTPPPHNVSHYMVAVHGRGKEEQDVINLTARLRVMLKIVKKIPIQRSSAEVKHLSLHLAHFPDLKLSQSPQVLAGVASRAVAESIPRHGYSLPDRGGVYLVLQGSIEKLVQDKHTKEFTSTILKGGECFGDLEENHEPYKSSYPLYTSWEASVLMRITVFDYHRVLQKCQMVCVNEKLQLVSSCRLLQSISPAVLSKIADAVTWETVQADKTLLNEDATIEKVGFIENGKCLAYARVPSTRRSARVCVGVLAASDCIGELMLRGCDIQPYSVVTATKTTIGWVSAAVIRVNEVEKHVLSDKPLAIETPLQEELRHKYADKVVQKHWGRIKQDIVNEVVMERGIKRGQSKWKHSLQEH